MSGCELYIKLSALVSMFENNLHVSIASLIRRCQKHIHPWLNAQTYRTSKQEKTAKKRAKETTTSKRLAESREAVVKLVKLVKLELEGVRREIIRREDAGSHVGGEEGMVEDQVSLCVCVHFCVFAVH